MPTKSVHAQTTLFVQADVDETVEDLTEETPVDLQTTDETDTNEEGGVLTNAYVVLGLMLFFVFCVMYIVYILS